MPAPRLTFFTELDAEPLDRLFTPALTADLVAMKARVSLAVLDFSDQRAEVVQRLNQAGVPLTAWLLLPVDQGYWFNWRNAEQAAAVYRIFKEWTDAHGLQWQAVGLDIEPDIREMKLFGEQRWRTVPTMVRRLFDGQEMVEARRVYRRLVEEIRRDGYRVESYQIHLLADERLARSHLLQRVTGMLDLPVDREVMMLYSSFFRTADEQVAPGYLWSYAPQAQAIGIGSTGGGVETFVGDKRPLSWAELARDLRLAWHWNDHLYIFSLEGCVQQGFLPRLKNFVWDQPVMIPEEGAALVSAKRKGLHALLWTGSHAGVVILSVLGVSLALFVFRLLLGRRR
jgi:hypothetical protein